MPSTVDLPAAEYAEKSDPGRDPGKQVNEDALGHRETRFGHLCVVCDGMGGHAAGREAAELALATIFETFDRAPDGATPAQVLRDSIEEASRRVHVMQTNEVSFGRPGSTVVAALMHAGGTEIAHVGDSRAYLVHEGQILRATRDHSVVQEMVDRGLITADQAAQHPDANRITRALGMTAEVAADVRPEAVHHVTGDTFVLCSDGLTDLVDDLEILLLVGDSPAAQAVGRLVDLANARGGHDNISVLVLRARQSALASATPAVGTVPSVTPTVAQTLVEEPAALPMPPMPPGMPLAGPPAVRVPEVVVGPSPPDRTGRRPGPIVVVGLGLAAIAVAVLCAILAAHVAGRGGKRNAPSSPLEGPHTQSQQR
jgi:protein phosphatase